MKIFICEHACDLTPSGASHAAPAGFAGDILLQSLISDLSYVGNMAVSILREPSARKIDVPASISIVPLHPRHACKAVEACISQADAVWPLAPESNGMLASISRNILHHKKILLGSTPDAVHLAGSKYRTSQALRAAGILVVPTLRTDANLPAGLQGLVVKPDQGAGCLDTHIFSHAAAAREWIAAQTRGDYVLQPYISGRPCSLSLLCGNNEVFLLGCNDQRVAVSDHQFHYLGSTVNSIDDADGELLRLASRVIAAIPGLWGYVGIDLIITEQGPVVLGVNPRMTMSHAGLHASIGANPASMLFDMLQSGHCGMAVPHASRQVSVDINAASAANASVLLH